MSNKRENTKRLVICSIFCALIVVLQFLSYFVKIGTVSLSFVLVPIVLGGALFGPKYGAMFGGVFGIMTVIGVITGIDVGGGIMFEANPVMTVILCLLKATAAGFLSALVYKLMTKVIKNGYVSTLISAIVCPIVNTGIFCAFMPLFFMKTLKAWAGGEDLVSYILFGLAGVNFVVELVINIVLCPVIKNSVKAFKKI